MYFRVRVLRSFGRSPNLPPTMTQTLPSDLNRLFSHAAAERRRQIEEYRTKRRKEEAEDRARMEARRRAARVEQAFAGFWRVADRLRKELPEIAHACRDRQIREHHRVIRAATARHNGQP